MTQSEVDEALARLRAEGEAIGAAMADLETHPGHQFLASATLTGATARRWQAAQDTIAQLWIQIADYHSVIEQAQRVRDRRHRPGQQELDELTELLRGRSVVGASRDVPLEQRGLTGPATVVDRMTLLDLVARMTAAYQSVVELVALAQDVLSGYAKPLDDLAGQVTGLETLANSLGLPESGHPIIAGIIRLNTALAELRELMFTDPLALCVRPSGRPARVDLDRLQPVAAELRTVRTELDALAAFRAHADDRLRGAAADLDRVAAAEAEAGQADRTVRARLSVTGLPPVRAALPELRERFALLGRLCAGGQWTQAMDLLAALDTGVAEALRRAATARDTANALLGRHAELGGRLDAYRAKAGRLGFGEDADLTAAYQRAKTVLRSSPCDLAAATRALADYQRLITDKESTR